MVNQIKPAPYSKNSNIESDGINLLKSLLPSNYFRAYINENDKTPNTDGYIDLIENNVSIGKIEVQIKSHKNLKENTKQSIKLPLLAFIRDSQLPFLIISICINSRKVYWKYISKREAKDLLNASLKKNNKSTTISFDSSNEISDLNHYEKWTNIIIEHKKASKLGEKIIENILCPHELESIEKYIENKKRDYSYTYINQFIDKLNYLINYDFKVVKKFINKDFYKLGIIIFGEFNEKRLNYSLYHINHDEIQLPIKFLDESKQFDYLFNNLTGHNFKNLIIHSPYNHAYEILFNFLKKLISKGYILSNNRILKAEFIQYHNYFTFRNKNQSNSVFLSILYDNVNNYLLKLDSFTKEHYSNFYHLDDNLYRLQDYIEDFRIEGITELQKLSPSLHDFTIINDTVLESNFSMKNILKFIFNYYKIVYDCYEDIISELFYNIKDELSFQNYQIFVVPELIILEDKYKTIDINIIVTKPTNPKIKNKIQPIVTDNLNILEDLKINKYKSFSFKNKDYKFVSLNSRTKLHTLTNKFPIKTAVYKLLESKLNDYFQSKY